MDHKDKHQAHGMTVGEMEDLHYKQTHDPDSIEMIDPNNGGDKISDEYFYKDFGDYKLPVHEAHLYHVAIEARTFAASGAKPVRSSVSVIQKFTPIAYEFQKKNGGFAGQIVHIVHNPELNAGYKAKPEAQGEGSEGGNGNGPIYPTAEELDAMTVPKLKDLHLKISGVAAKETKKAELVEEVELAIQNAMQK